MRRRIVRAGVAIGVSTVSLVGLASPAWAPRIHRGEIDCSQWRAAGYENRGQCVRENWAAK